MKNLITQNNNNYVEKTDNKYLYFHLDDKKYAVKISQVVEIIKLPHLEYPQKLANNIVGLLNYNNLMINVLDLRFYLNMSVKCYTLHNQLLIVKTDESIFGLIIDGVDDVINIDVKMTDTPSAFDESGLIDFLYTTDEETIAIINLYSVETIIKHGAQAAQVDIPSLFPTDETSKNKFLDRSKALEEKFKYNIAKNVFSQNKFISFSLNQSSFCININFIKEFLKNVPITKVPCTPNYIEGLINLRGEFISIINLKHFIGIPAKEDPQDNSLINNKIIIVENRDIKIGLLVDKIFNIMDIPDEIITQNSTRQLNKYVLSEVVDDNNLYTILNMPNILSDEKMYIEEKV